MRKVNENYLRLNDVICSLDFKNEIDFTKEIHANNLKLFNYGKAFKDSYLLEVNKYGDLFASPRSFIVDGGIAVIKTVTDSCMKIAFVWFDEIYERRINVELFWWFADCESESFFCVRFMK